MLAATIAATVFPMNRWAKAVREGVSRKWARPMVPALDAGDDPVGKPGRRGRPRSPVANRPAQGLILRGHLATIGTFGRVVQ